MIVSIPQKLPNGLNLWAAKIEPDHSEGKNTNKLTTVDSECGRVYHFRNLDSKKDKYHVTVLPGESISIQINRDETLQTTKLGRCYSWRESHSWHKKMDPETRFNTAIISVLPATQKFILADVNNPVHKAILTQYQERLKKDENIKILHDNPQPVTYQERKNTFESTGFKQRDAKKMAKRGLYIKDMNAQTKELVIKCQTCFFDQVYNPESNWNAGNIKKDHKQVHKEDSKERGYNQHNKLTAFTQDQQQLRWYIANGDPANEIIVVPTTDRQMHISEIFSQEYDDSELKKALDVYEEKITTIKSVVNENQRKTAAVLGRPIPGATVPIFLDISLKLKPNLLRLFNMTKMIQSTQKQSPNEANLAIALESCESDIIGELESISSTLKQHGMKDLLALAADQSEIKKAQSSEKEILPEACTERATLGTDFLGAITTEIITPLKEYAGTDDLLQALLATVGGRPGIATVASLQEIEPDNS